jgi:hypothetical protein
LQAAEFTSQPKTFKYIDVTGQEKTVELPAGSLAFTFCQVPIIIQRGAGPKLTVRYTGNSVEETFGGNTLTAETSQHIFERDNHVEEIRFQM